MATDVHSDDLDEGHLWKLSLSGFAGRMRHQCKSQDLHIGRALWCHQVDFAELLSTLAATWTNLWTGSYLSRPENHLYYDVDNQCTQLVVSSFFIGWKYWESKSFCLFWGYLPGLFEKAKDLLDASTTFVGPAGSGKTTILRDIAMNLAPRLQVPWAWHAAHFGT